MKFKLDENLGEIGKTLLEADGHDVMTVTQQQLAGVSDDALFDIVRHEDRALITLDRDFGEVLRFPPESSAGIVVLAIVGRTSLSAILARMSELVVLLRSEPLAGSLWIVEPGRLRIHQRRA